MIQVSRTFTPKCRTEDNNTALYRAAQYGFKRVVKELLEHGAETVINLPKKANPEGYTPLIVARENNHKDVVKILLEYGANDDRPAAVDTIRG